MTVDQKIISIYKYSDAIIFKPFGFVDSDKKFVASDRSKAGQILVESMVAISLTVVGLLGIFTLLSRSLSLNRTVGDHYTGTNLAAEGIELIKNLIDHNVLQGIPWNSGGCLAPGNHELAYNDDSNSGCLYENKLLKFDPPTGLYSYQNGTETKFKRTIVIDWPAADQIKVNSQVAWEGRGGGQFEVNLEDQFYRWAQ